MSILSWLESRNSTQIYTVPSSFRKKYKECHFSFGSAGKLQNCSSVIRQATFTYVLLLNDNHKRKTISRKQSLFASTFWATFWKIRNEIKSLHWKENISRCKTKAELIWQSDSQQGGKVTQLTFFVSLLVTRSRWWDSVMNTQGVLYIWTPIHLDFFKKYSCVFNLFMDFRESANFDLKRSKTKRALMNLDFEILVTYYVLRQWNNFNMTSDWICHSSHAFRFLQSSGNATSRVYTTGEVGEWLE